MPGGSHTQRVITTNVGAKGSETGYVITERIQVDLLSKLHVYVIQEGEADGVDVYFYGSATEDGKDVRPINHWKEYSENSGGRVILTSSIPSFGFVIAYEDIPSYISASMCNWTDAPTSIKIIFDMWR